MNLKTIIVPYRNRPGHLEEFMQHMQQRMPHMPICIVEQREDDKPFNRAKLLNIGAIEFPSMWYIMHDVDMLPLFDHYDASPFAEVIQFASSKIQLRDYLGGVTMFTHPILHKIGGYNNEYFHRAEDNEMMFNVKRLRIPVLNDFKPYKQLPHKRTTNEFDAALWDKAQEKRSEQNQLAHCAYKILNKDIIGNVTHLVVGI